MRKGKKIDWENEKGKFGRHLSTSHACSHPDMSVQTGLRHIATSQRHMLAYVIGMSHRSSDVLILWQGHCGKPIVASPLWQGRLIIREAPKLRDAGLKFWSL